MTHGDGFWRAPRKAPTRRIPQFRVMDFGATCGGLLGREVCQKSVTRNLPISEFHEVSGPDSRGRVPTAKTVAMSSIPVHFSFFRLVVTSFPARSASFDLPSTSVVFTECIACCRHCRHCQPLSLLGVLVAVPLLVVFAYRHL